MQKFIIKIFIFIFIPVLPVSLLFLIFANYLNQNTQLNNYSFNNSIESKIFMLKENINDSFNIVIAGDSRAERQLIPQTLTSTTGINSINIAISAGDLALTVPALTAFSDSNIFIISASSWQINDGAIDPGYLSLKCFQQFSPLDKLKIYKYNHRELVNMYTKLIKSSLNKIINNNENYFYSENIIQEYGFLGVEDTLKLDKENLPNLLNSHAWYKNINSNGSRYQVFVESFEQLDKRNSLVIIYQPPVSPAWKEKTKNTLIGQFENEYSKRLDSLCSKSDNILFYDFYSQDIKQLDNSMYYDYQHLNRNGAEIFSKLFAEEINRLMEARTHNRVDG